MSKSAIEWTDYTFNPWWGCKKVSPACKNCYAERTAKRFEDRKLWGENSGFKFQSNDYWKKPFGWNERAGRNNTQYLVFAGSMCDIFQDDDRLEEQRQRLFKRIRQTPNLWWLLLTKRPENVQKWAEDIPFWNTWLGVTVENQKAANERIPEIMDYPAPIKFVSCEPLLEELNLLKWIDIINWVIAGGESGNNPRRIDPDWVRSLNKQCKKTDTPFFFKQWEDNIPEGQAEKQLDGETYREFPDFKKLVTLKIHLGKDD